MMIKVENDNYYVTTGLWTLTLYSYTMHLLEFDLSRTLRVTFTLPICDLLSVLNGDIWRNSAHLLLQALKVLGDLGL